MKIVFLVHYFPPLNSAGARRIIGFARFLNEGGHEVAVVTTVKNFITPSDGESVPENIQTITLGDNASDVKKPFHDNNRAVNRTKMFEAMRSFKRWLSFYLGQLPDSRLFFALRFIHPVFHRKAVSLLESADIIISSSPPWPMHLSGLLVKLKYKKPWLLDYRDSFSENHIFRGSSISRWIEFKLDELFCRNADRLSAVSEPISKYYNERFGILTRTISNGFDPDILNDNPSGLKNKIHESPFVIRYIGTIYKIELIPRSLFYILSDDFGGRYKNVFFEFVGDCSLVSDVIFNEYPELKDRVKIIPKVQYDVALKLMKSADALLFIETSSNGSLTAEGVLTTKIFEYIASSRPILAVVDENTLMGEVLLGSGLCYNASVDSSKICSSLDALLSGNFKPVLNFDFINSYSQRNITKILIEWLDLCMANHKINNC